MNLLEAPISAPTMNSTPMNPAAHKILSTALAAFLILAILGLLTAIWLPGLIVHQPPANQQIVTP
jgi:hypothetical protein